MGLFEKLVPKVAALFARSDCPLVVLPGQIPRVEREYSYNQVLIRASTNPIYSLFRSKLIDFVSEHGLFHKNFSLYMAPFSLFMPIEAIGTYQAYEVRVLGHQGPKIVKQQVDEQKDRSLKVEVGALAASYGSVLEVENAGSSSVVRMLGMKEEVPPYKIAEQDAMLRIAAKAEESHRVPYKFVADEGPKMCPGVFTLEKTCKFETCVEDLPEGLKVIDSPSNTIISVLEGVIKKPTVIKVGTAGLKKSREASSSS